MINYCTQFFLNGFYFDIKIDNIWNKILIKIGTVGIMKKEKIQTLKDFFKYETSYEGEGWERIIQLRDFMADNIPKPDKKNMDCFIYEPYERHMWHILDFVRCTLYGKKGCLESNLYLYRSNEMYIHALSELEKIFLPYKDYQLPFKLWYNIVKVLTMLIGSEEDMLYVNVLYSKSLSKKFLFKNKYKIKDELNKSLYQKTLDRIDCISPSNINDKKEFYSFAMSLIRNDLKFDFVADTFYSDEIDIPRLINGVFPVIVKDKNGEYFFPEGGKKKEIVELNLSEIDVICFPRSDEKLRRAFSLYWKKEFAHEEQVYYYYPQIDFCITTGDGHHSTSLAIARKKGSINATVVDMTPLFENIYTDGTYWYSKYDNKKLKGNSEEVQDFRIAVLFELARRKHFNEY